MSEAFTAIEYAILLHLKEMGRCTVPSICSDLLLRPSEVEMTLSTLVTKNFAKREGEFYLPGDVCLETPNPHAKKGTRNLGIAKFPIPAAAAAPAPAEVASVFQKARDRAKREKAGGI